SSHSRPPPTSQVSETSPKGVVLLEALHPDQRPDADARSRGDRYALSPAATWSGISTSKSSDAAVSPFAFSVPAHVTLPDRRSSDAMSQRMPALANGARWLQDMAVVKESTTGPWSSMNSRVM